ncbi:hypothetical protein [Rhodovulum euryhalinum]|uniref:hypothetical protein n=1 Tax=Rhodovulum euryhalinum TaxID=35805 RepID=UPI00104E71B7|nr:hypothetical protein [Rhodovulum euryhalinum]
MHAEAFTLRPGIVVLDLRDGPAPGDSPFERPLISEDVAPPAETRPTVRVPQVRLPLDAGRRATALVVGRFIPPKVPDLAAATDPRVADARSELMKQIGRAAAQGLLEPADIAPAPALHPPGHQGHDSAEASDPPPEPSLPGLGDRPNMHVETSIDRGYGPGANGQDRSALGDPCYPDSYFDLASWGAHLPPAALIADRRGSLLNMRDAADPDGAGNLVRAYLALGFGAEARAVIDTVGLDTPPAAIWRQLGAIIDSGLADTPELFDGQISCPSRAALWAALARPQIPSVSDVDEAAVIRGFSELPLHLRRHLGPILAERFLSSGETAAATRVRNAVARAGDKTRSGELTLVEARLDLSQGETDSAEARIAEVLSEGGPSSPEAIVLQLETDLAAGQVPEADALALAEALAYERRGTALGSRLLELAIRGHAARGNFATAFGMLVHHGLDTREELVSDLVRGLAGQGDDAELLRQAFVGVLARPEVSVVPNARFAVADRLLRLGFAARAEEIVAMIPPQGTSQERLVRARLALAAGRPEQATQYLSEVDTPEADLLRAEAARSRGDLAMAADYYAAAGETGKQAELAWRDRDWSTVEAKGPETQSGYAVLRQQTPAASFDPAAEPSLSGARALLEGSEAMRDRLKDLLVSSGPR